MGLDDFLDENVEVHAFAIGVFEGFKDFRDWKGIESENADVVAEPHYAKTGYVIGAFLRVLIYVILAYAVWRWGVPLVR